jgi:hypothetical protein
LGSAPRQDPLLRGNRTRNRSNLTDDIQRSDWSHIHISKTALVERVIQVSAKLAAVVNAICSADEPLLTLHAGGTTASSDDESKRERICSMVVVDLIQAIDGFNTKPVCEHWLSLAQKVALNEAEALSHLIRHNGTADCQAI